MVANLQRTVQKLRGAVQKQVEAAAQLGIDQAKVSKLLAGQMAGFSIERLVHFLSLLGQDIEVIVRSAPRGRRLAQSGPGSRERWPRSLGSVLSFCLRSSD